MKKISIFMVFILIVTGLGVNVSFADNSSDEKNVEIKWLDESYDYGGIYSDGLVAVVKDGKLGFIDENGNVVIPLEYKTDIETTLSHFKDKAIPDEELKRMQISSRLPIFFSGIAYVFMEDKLIDKNNNEVSIPIDLDSFDAPAIFKTIPSFSKETKKMGLKDLNGKQIIEAKYDAVQPFSEGLAAVCNDGKWSYINKKGETVISLDDSYNQALSFHSDRALCFIKDKGFCYINKKGETLFFIEKLYPNSNYVYNFLANPNFASCGNRTKATLFDKNFNIIFEKKCKRLEPTLDGTFCASYENGKSDYLDEKNNVIFSVDATNINTMNEGIALVFKDGRTGILKNPFYKGKTENKGSSNSNSSSNSGSSSSSNNTSTTVVTTSDDISSWAIEQVNKAIAKNLIPIELQNNYKKPITRKDFSQLVVRLIEVVKDKNIDVILKEKTNLKIEDIVKKEKFDDTDDKNIIAARVLGIINGVGNNKFNPDGEITRQDAAVLLRKTAKYLGKEDSEFKLTYKDKDKIRKYAKKSVAFVSKNKIMSGTGKNMFSPRKTYTRQQAYVTIYRLYTICIE